VLEQRSGKHKKDLRFLRRRQISLKFLPRNIKLQLLNKI
jgi:hypothetical protein